MVAGNEGGCTRIRRQQKGDILEVQAIRCLDSSLVACPPATPAEWIRFPAETCLSRGAFLEDGENLGHWSSLSIATSFTLSTL